MSQVVNGARARQLVTVALVERLVASGAASSASAAEAVVVQVLERCVVMAPVTLPEEMAQRVPLPEIPGALCAPTVLSEAKNRRRKTTGGSAVGGQGKGEEDKSSFPLPIGNARARGSRKPRRVVRAAVDESQLYPVIDAACTALGVGALGSRNQGYWKKAKTAAVARLGEDTTLEQLAAVANTAARLMREKGAPATMYGNLSYVWGSGFPGLFLETYGKAGSVGRSAQPAWREQMAAAGSDQAGELAKLQG